MLALVGLACALVPSAAFGDHTASGPSVSPTVHSGNLTCKTLLGNDSAYEIKVDPPKSGSYGPLTVRFYDGGRQLEFTSTVPVLGVFVKGGNEGGSFYDYRPAGATSDANLTVPTNQAISHVSFCWNNPPVTANSLTATKTANGTWTRTTTWDLVKSVSPTSHAGSAGGGTAGTSDWSVVATRTDTASLHRVTGTITVSNPNTFAVPVTVDDRLSDGTVATVDCDPTLAGNQPLGSVPATGTLSCSYTASPSDALATSNNALISSGDTRVPGATALSPITWTRTDVGDQSVTLADPRLDDYSQRIDQTTTLSPAETFSCSSNPADYTNGSRTETHTNVATLTGAGTGTITREAAVTVNCTLPLVTAVKTAVAGYHRTITWDLAKTASPTSVTGTAGESAGSSTWSVTATRNVTESSFSVTGEITVTNPAEVAQPFSVTDVLNDGTVAGVDCDSSTQGDQPSGTVAARSGDQPGTAVCTYRATPTGRTATLNTATVTVGDRTVRATAPVSFTATVIGQEQAVLADPRFTPSYSRPISDTTTITDVEAFSCPADPALYTDGSNTRTETNTATLTVGGQTITRTADVDVTCTLPALSVSKTALGSYDNTNTWGLTKSAHPATHAGVAGQTFSSTWSVAATRSEAQSAHLVSGTITVTNGAAIAQSFSLSDVLSDGTVAAVDCDPGTTGDQSTGTVPAMVGTTASTVTCTYRAAPADAGATDNTVTVTAAGNAPVPVTWPITWTAKQVGDTTVALADPRLGYSRSISSSTSFDQAEQFTCPTDPSRYTNRQYSETFPNTATLTGASTALSASATVTVRCTLPEVWAGETATGAGKTYPGSSNWFMYTPYTTSKVDLIAGQHHDAGDVFMSRSGGTTQIRIVLHDGWRWADVQENLKIHAFDREPTGYVSPGAYAYKWTVSGSTVTVSLPNTGKTKFFGIHADVERRVS